MPKKEESPEATQTKKEKVEVKEETQAVVASEPKTEKLKEDDLKPVAPLIPFSRWFNARGYKPHWKAGMEAYADTSGKKTVEAWDTIFKNY